MNENELLRREDDKRWLGVKDKLDNIDKNVLGLRIENKADHEKFEEHFVELNGKVAEHEEKFIKWELEKARREGQEEGEQLIKNKAYKLAKLIFPWIKNIAWILIIFGFLLAILQPDAIKQILSGLTGQ